MHNLSSFYVNRRSRLVVGCFFFYYFLLIELKMVWQKKQRR